MRVPQATKLRKSMCKDQNCCRLYNVSVPRLKVPLIGWGASWSLGASSGCREMCEVVGDGQQGLVACHTRYTWQRK
jgi:hypothetical protein